MELEALLLLASGSTVTTAIGALAVLVGQVIRRRLHKERLDRVDDGSDDLEGALPSEKESD